MERQHFLHWGYEEPNKNNVFKLQQNLVLLIYLNTIRCDYTVSIKQMILYFKNYFVVVHVKVFVRKVITFVIQ